MTTTLSADLPDFAKGYAATSKMTGLNILRLPRRFAPRNDNHVERGLTRLRQGYAGRAFCGSVTLAMTANGFPLARE
ncbi:MAG: hypothetical protein PHY02_04195 [Phycisphaerae bacterium]|nr:hypothetical protein [Phycisphaerae bacterium]